VKINKVVIVVFSGRLISIVVVNLPTSGAVGSPVDILQITLWSPLHFTCRNNTQIVIQHLEGLTKDPESVRLVVKARDHRAYEALFLVLVLFLFLFFLGLLRKALVIPHLVAAHGAVLHLCVKKPCDRTTEVEAVTT
jgi:hypothetical protein